MPGYPSVLEQTLTSRLKFENIVLLENETQIFLCSFQLGLYWNPFFALKLLMPGHLVEISIYSFTHSKRYLLSTCCMLGIAFSDVFYPES